MNKLKPEVKKHDPVLQKLKYCKMEDFQLGIIEILKKSELKLNIWMDYFFAIKSVSGISFSSLINYRTSFKHFKKVYHKRFKSYNLKYWNRQITQDFVDKLKDQYSPYTVESYFTALKSLASWIKDYRNDIFQYDIPFDNISLPIKKVRESKALTKTEIEKIKSVVKENATRKQELIQYGTYFLCGDTRRAIRDQAIFFVLLNLGLRNQEICDLTLNQLHSNYFHKVKCKGNFYRDVEIPINTYNYIKLYIETERKEDENLFINKSPLFLIHTNGKSISNSGKVNPLYLNTIIKRIKQDSYERYPELKNLLLTSMVFRHSLALNIANSTEKNTQHLIDSILGHTPWHNSSHYTIPFREDCIKIINEFEQK